MKEDRQTRRNGPIHKSFGLTKASFLVIPRTVLMDMPTEWQNRMVDLIDELNDATQWENDVNVNLYVTARAKNGFAKMPRWLSDYKHPGNDMYKHEIEHYTKDKVEKTTVTWFQKLKVWLGL